MTGHFWATPAAPAPGPDHAESLAAVPPTEGAGACLPTSSGVVVRWDRLPVGVKCQASGIVLLEKGANAEFGGKALGERVVRLHRQLKVFKAAVRHKHGMR